MQISVKVPVTVRVEYSGEDGHDAGDLLRDILESNPRIQPARVIVDCPYAQYVEFGTAPARRGAKSEPPLEKEIYEWTRDKLGIVEEKELKRVSRAIYWKIIKEGLLPMPYLRPAIHDAMSEVREDWLDMGHSIQDIAESIVFRAKGYLELNDQNYTHGLEQSISVDESFLRTGPREGSEIDDYVWDSTELGYDGMKRPDFRRWKRA